MKENEKKVKEKKKRGQPEGFPRSILTRPVWSGHVLRGVPARPNSGQASVIASSTKEAVLRRPANKCNQCELATIHTGNMKSPQCSNLTQPQSLPQASRILCSRITVSLHPSMKAAYEDAHEKTQRKDSKREGEIVLGVPTWDSHHTPAAWVKPHCLKYLGGCEQELVESSSSDEKA